MHPLRLLLPALAAVVFTCSALAQTAEILLPDAELAATVAQHRGQPLRYAVDHPLELDLRHGSWDEPQPGLARWRLQLRSPGASSLSARLDDVRLPPEAELRLLGADALEAQGPLRADADGRLWTPIVRGETAILELRLPAALRDDAQLRLVSAQHGFRDPFSTPGDHASAKAAGDAGGCNVDAACSEGMAWSREARATVLLTIGNVHTCTGTLVNNAREDDEPLVLTANHCGVHDDEDVRATLAYFQVQRSDCYSSAPAPRDLNIAGGRLLARDTRADFALFTLATVPPPSYRAYYAGWDASGSAPQSGVVLHHPRGDDRKISLFTTPAQRADGVRIGEVNGFDVDAWGVQWARGTTESGSSGAGLWNQDRRLAGVLSGGFASCVASDATDYFARLDRAWWRAGAARGAQLKAHLDPDDSGCRTLDGKEAGAQPTGTCHAQPPANESRRGGGTMSTHLLLGLLLVAAGLRRRRSPINAPTADSRSA